MADPIARLAAEIRRPLPDPAPLAELVRFATLAPNSHNTQPWRLRLSASRVTILPDATRRTPVVDPDDHHLWVSLGCAAETFAIAAAARGSATHMAQDPGDSGRIVLDLERGPRQETALFTAIPRRQCSRTPYDGRDLPADTLARLAADSGGEGARLVLITEPARRETVLEAVLAGHRRQVNDAAFVAELVAWIRFDRAEALASRDGLASRCGGNPSLPRWLGRRRLLTLMRRRAALDRLARLIRSSSALAIVVSDRDEPAGWLAAGRLYARFALAATALGLAHAHINQAVEVPDLRQALAAALDLGGKRPDLVLRLGSGPALPMSLRRPVEAVIEPG